MAPEQIKGEELDGRADVYSLGCVLYECLTGSPPFRRDSEVATMYAHLEQDVPAPSSKRSGVPQPLDSVVAKATAKRPDDRFVTAGDMAAGLRGGPVPDGTWKQRLRWRIAIAALVVIASLVGFLTLNDEDAPTVPPAETTGPALIPLGSLVQVDADTGDILATVPGFASNFTSFPSIAVGEGGVWILSGDNVTHVDGDDASVVERTTVGAGLFGTESIAVGFRTIWIGSVPGIVRIDPIDGDKLRPVRIYPPGVYNGSQVALGASSAWVVTGDGELTRVEPTSGRRSGIVDVGQTASGLAVGFEAVWVIDKLQGTLTRVDPDTLVVDDPMQIGGELDEIEAGAGAVWLLDQGAGIVTPIDPVSGSVGSPIRVGLEPTDLAVGLDAVWVANLEDGTISRIDPVTRGVKTISIGSPVAAIAVDESSRSLWIVVTRMQN